MRPKVLVFIGIDGAGKTTIINEVEQRLAQAGKRYRLEYMGLGRNYTVPAFGRALALYTRLKYRKKKKAHQERSVRDNYRIRGFAWVTVQYLELWSRYIRFRCKRDIDYVLCDRYFFDGLILSNTKTYKIFRKLTPRPAKSFLIQADPETIVGRKKEANEGNVIDFYDRVEKLKQDFPISVVNNDRELPLVVDEVMRDIGTC